MQCIQKHDLTLGRKSMARMWMVHHVRKRITRVLTVLRLNADQNWRRELENALGGFIPQARVRRSTDGLKLFWMVHSKRIRK
jgi:hypothetical protein